MVLCSFMRLTMSTEMPLFLERGYKVWSLDSSEPLEKAPTRLPSHTALN